ncbi:hypothetical protein [Streptomyces sp. NPDC059479]
MSTEVAGTDLAGTASAIRGVEIAKRGTTPSGPSNRAAEPWQGGDFRAA